MALYTRLLPISFRIPAILRDNRSHDLAATRKLQEYRYSILIEPLIINGNQAASNLLEENRRAEAADDSFLEPVTEEYANPDCSTDISALECGILAKPQVANRERVKNLAVERRLGLIKHIRAQNWAQAERLRDEYFEHGLHIKRDPLYIEAAIQAWRTKPSDQKTLALYHWLSLIPHATSESVKKTRPQLRTLKETIISEAPTDVDTMACMGLVVARKGYANFFCHDILVHIARYCPPSLSRIFFKSVEMSALKYHERFGKKADLQSTVWKRVEFHNVYLRTLLFSGYCQEAVDHLRYMASKKTPIEVQRFSWQVLLQELDSLNLKHLFDEVSELLSNFGPAMELMPQVDRPKLPSTKDIAKSFREILDSGDNRALAALKREIVETHRQIDLWTAAQMRFYQNGNQHDLALKAFLKHFLCIGVPGDLLIDYSSTGNRDLEPLLQLDCESLPGTKAGRWPSTHVLTMAWKSMTTLATSVQQLEVLYRTFLNCWDNVSGSSPIETTEEGQNSWVSLRFQHPPVTSPDTVMFHPFLVGFRKFGQLTRVLDVLTDMDARGIRPNAHNWSVIAGIYVWDNPLAVQRILSRMENNSDDYADSPVTEGRVRTRLGPIQRPPNWVPRPTVVIYTDILRGLIESRKLREAREFATHVQHRGFFPENNEHLNFTFRILEEREERQSWRDRLYPSQSRHDGT